MAIKGPMTSSGYHFEIETTNDTDTLFQISAAGTVDRATVEWILRYVQAFLDKLPPAPAD